MAISYYIAQLPPETPTEITENPLGVANSTKYRQILNKVIRS
jgi:hypothetical protein